jgi:hypothetical protein
MAVAMTRDDFSASDLRQAAARRNDSAMAWRALALALVLEGKSRSGGRAQWRDGPADAARLGASV